MLCEHSKQGVALVCARSPFARVRSCCQVLVVLPAPWATACRRPGALRRRASDRVLAGGEPRVLVRCLTGFGRCAARRARRRVRQRVLLHALLIHRIVCSSFSHRKGRVSFVSGRKKSKGESGRSFCALHVAERSWSVAVMAGQRAIAFPFFCFFLPLTVWPPGTLDEGETQNPGRPGASPPAPDPKVPNPGA